MTDNVKLSAIDRALAAAKARKAAKEAAGVTPDLTEVVAKIKAPKPAKVAKVKTPKEIDPSLAEARSARQAERAAAKAEKLAQLEAERTARKAAREARKAEKAASKAVVVPAHLKKVERAKAKLPQLNEEMQKEFNGIISNFGLYQLEALAMHLQLHTRTEKTVRATKGGPLPIGATVTIYGGDPRYIGKTGKVLTSQKLRATVAVEGAKKPVYIYTSEAKVTA